MGAASSKANYFYQWEKKVTFLEALKIVTQYEVNKSCFWLKKKFIYIVFYTAKETVGFSPGHFYSEHLNQT